MKTEYQTVEEYIGDFPLDVQGILQKIRSIVEENAPGAIESISYGMPAYKAYGKPLVYFASFKKHIGFYATPSGHSEFADELSRYKQGKGSVQFPLSEPIPYALIGRMVAFRYQQNMGGK